MGRVLVTGHDGYVGSVLCPILMNAGYDVVGIDTRLFRHCDFGSAPQPVHEVIEKDIRDIGLEDLDDIQGAIHLAGLSNDPLGDLDPELTHAINYEAAVRLARLAKAAGVGRFIAASSCSIYGASEGEGLLVESSPANPVTPYAAAKAAMEADLTALSGDGFEPVFIRPGTVYGMSPRIRFDLVLNNLVAWAMTTGEVLLKSDGQAWRPLLHVNDLSRAIVALFEAPAALVSNRAFNLVATEENHRVIELAQIVAETVPGSRLRFSDGFIADRRNYRVSGDLLAQTLPDLKFDWTLGEGAAELYAAYRQIGLRHDDFEGQRYQRLAHLKARIADGSIGSDLRPNSVSGLVEVAS